MVEKFRIGLALQPVANALFAASPFKEGKPTGWVFHQSNAPEETRGAGCIACGMWRRWKLVQVAEHLQPCVPGVPWMQ